MTAAIRAKNREYFKSFWNAYPKKQGLSEAERVFSDIVEGTLSREPVDPIHLIEKAKAFARDQSEADQQFIPSPASWLRNGRYDDQDLFASQSEADKAWLNKCWEDCDVISVERRLRVTFDRPPLPDGMDDPATIRAWHRSQCRKWIKAQRALLAQDEV